MGMPSMVQMLDVQVVIREVMALDWKTFVSRAKEREAAPFVLAALRLAKHLVAADVPEWVEEDLMAVLPQRLRRRTMDLDLAAVLQHSMKKPLNSLTGS